MSDTTTWYKTNRHFGVCTVQVVKETAKTVTIRYENQGRRDYRANKESEYESYFPTEEAAVGHLVEYWDGVIRRSSSNIEIATAELKKLKGESK